MNIDIIKNINQNQTTHFQGIHAEKFFHVCSTATDTMDIHLWAFRLLRSANEAEYHCAAALVRIYPHSDDPGIHARRHAVGPEQLPFEIEPATCGDCVELVRVHQDPGRVEGFSKHRVVVRLDPGAPLA